MNREEFDKISEEISASYEPVHPSVAEAIKYQKEREESYFEAMRDAYPNHFTHLSHAGQMHHISPGHIQEHARQMQNVAQLQANLTTNPVAMQNQQYVPPLPQVIPFPKRIPMQGLVGHLLGGPGWLR